MSCIAHFKAHLRPFQRMHVLGWDSVHQPSSLILCSMPWVECRFVLLLAPAFAPTTWKVTTTTTVPTIVMAASFKHLRGRSATTYDHRLRHHHRHRHRYHRLQHCCIIQKVGLTRAVVRTAKQATTANAKSRSGAPAATTASTRPCQKEFRAALVGLEVEMESRLQQKR